MIDGSTKSADLPLGILPPERIGTATPRAGGGGGGGPGGGGDLNGGGAADFDFFGSFQPDCPDFENQTFIDGECKDNFVDPAALPDYEDTLVYGSGSPTNQADCFEVATCFQGAGAISESGGDVQPPPTDGGVREMTFEPQAISLNRSSCAVLADEYRSAHRIRSARGPHRPADVDGLPGRLARREHEPALVAVREHRDDGHHRRGRVRSLQIGRRRYVVGPALSASISGRRPSRRRRSRSPSRPLPRRACEC